MARASAGRQAVRHRTGWRCRTASGQAPGRTARRWAPGPGRTDPGQTDLGRPALALGPGRTGRVPAVRRRTDPARTRLVPAGVLPARILAVLATTAARDRRHPAVAEVPARHLASQDLAGRARAARRRTGPHRPGLYRPGPCRAARHPAGRPTPERAGVPLAARRVPLAAATRPRARLAAVPAGPARARGGPWPARGSTRVAPDTRAPAAPLRGRPDPGLVLVRTRKAPAAARRRIPPGAARAVVPSAAGPGAAGPGEPAAGGGWQDVPAGGQRPASRPLDAARVILGRTLPACLNVAGSRAWAACHAPAGCVTVRAAGPRGGGVHVPCRSRSPGSRDQRDRRRPPGKNPAGRRLCPRRQRRWPCRAFLGQARCPDDSPGTSWTHRAALATPDRV
jgi:hypothetical protein